jgi:hypothetical protein
MLKSGGVASPAREALSRYYGAAMKELAQEPTTMPKTNQTPFERFKSAVSEVLTFQKSSTPKPTKKSVKKK